MSCHVLAIIRLPKITIRFRDDSLRRLPGKYKITEFIFFFTFFLSVRNVSSKSESCTTRSINYSSSPKRDALLHLAIALAQGVWTRIMWDRGSSRSTMMKERNRFVDVSTAATLASPPLKIRSFQSGRIRNNWCAAAHKRVLVKSKGTHRKTCDNNNNSLLNHSALIERLIVEGPTCVSREFDALNPKTLSERARNDSLQPFIIAL